MQCSECEHEWEEEHIWICPKCGEPHREQMRKLFPEEPTFPPEITEDN
jgi:hypothetical protein